MDGWVIETLKTNGLAGVFIFVLLSANAAQWIRARSKDREIKDLNKQRADERETLVKLVEGANTAAQVTAAAIERRNEIMSELGSAVTAQAGSIERYEDRVAGQAEMLREKFTDFRHVIDSFGESNRVISGLVAEVRNSLTKLEAGINQIAIKLAAGRRS